MGCNCDSKLEELEIQTKDNMHLNEDFEIINKDNTVNHDKNSNSKEYNNYKSETLTTEIHRIIGKNELFHLISDKNVTINVDELGSKYNTIEILEKEDEEEEDIKEDNIDKTMPSDEFSKYIFDQINLLRENPSSFIELIQNTKSNITIDQKNRLIYKTKVKVALDKGIKAFEEAKLILSNTKPMEKLKFNYNMKLKLPKKDVNIKSYNYLKNQILIKADNGINIKSYWKEVISEPETCFVLMIVDDNGKKAGYKRRSILNPEYKYIGISSHTINNKFICYITLS